MPNEPPTSSASTRSRSGSILRRSSRERAAQPEHALAADVQREAPALRRRTAASAARGSMAATTTRLLTIRSRATWAAAANARSAAAWSPKRQSRQRLRVLVVQPRRIGAIAASGSTTAGSGSMSDHDQLGRLLRRVRRSRRPPPPASRRRSAPGRRPGSAAAARTGRCRRRS